MYDMLEKEVLQDVAVMVNALAKNIEECLCDGHRGEILREGIHVAIVGPPNAGKSSLLNILANRPAAIVSPVRGTTRDVLEIQIDVGGFPFVLADTAGWQNATNDPIEKEGILRSLQRCDTTI